MNSNTPTTTPDLEEDLDDLYVHTISTEEFVKTVEEENQEANGDELTTFVGQPLLGRRQTL